MSTTSYITECEKYSDEIISDICSLLSTNNIPYVKTGNGTELIIRETDKSKIISLVRDSDILPTKLFKFLLGVSAVGNTVYIRQKYK